VRRLATFLVLLLAGCREPDRVDARDYDAFWLWAGVDPQPVLGRARTLYVLDGEVRSGKSARFIPLRPGTPRLPERDLWLVIRTDTLDWPEPAYRRMRDDLASWQSGNRLQGVQIDFDAGTRDLGRYAEFLGEFRRRLPPRYRLSITGLMDWSANGDPRALATLKGTIDEIVVQTYQGRGTIPGYEAYFERMRGFDIPFRVGLVQGGRWIEPASLKANPYFQGYVVFLLKPR
jgi:hypothetical protein